MSCCALLITDDGNNLSVLGQVVSEKGLSVEECRDRSAVSRTLNAKHYDVILVDCPEPSSSDELLREIRNSALNKNSLIVAIVDLHTSARNTFGVGANFVLYRPVSLDRAKATLEGVSQLLQRERRRHPRASLCAETVISYPNVENAPATLVDLSEEGLAIQCERALPAKSKIYFRFALPGQMKSIQLSGNTVWQDSSGRAGIRFIDVPQSARRLLREWLSARIAFEESKVTVGLPLNPSRGLLSASDRRVQTRHACRLGSEIYREGFDVPHRCRLTDISVGGCYIEMPSPFATGTRVETVVRTQAFKFRSRGVVQVVHPGFGMGVAFVSQNNEQREQVRQLIKMIFTDREREGDAVLRF